MLHIKILSTVVIKKRLLMLVVATGAIVLSTAATPAELGDQLAKLLRHPIGGDPETPLPY